MRQAHPFCLFYERPTRGVSQNKLESVGGRGGGRRRKEWKRGNGWKDERGKKRKLSRERDSTESRPLLLIKTVSPIYHELSDTNPSESTQ